MSSFYIIGFNGNMAGRYKAILDYLGHDYCGEDIGLTMGHPAQSDGIIICTPTNTHISMIEHFKGYKLPILCEKPLSKNVGALTEKLHKWKSEGVNLQMINQYEHLPYKPAHGDGTLYDCWRTGDDGIEWDCINVIGLSKSHPVLKKLSPVWTLTLNGTSYHSKDIEKSYVKMISEWIRHPAENIGYCIETHQKVIQYIETQKRINSYSSKVN